MALESRKQEDFFNESWLTLRYQGLGMMEDDDERRSMYNEALNDCVEAAAASASNAQAAGGTGTCSSGMQNLELSTECDDLAAVTETNARALLASLSGLQTGLDNSILFAQDLHGGCSDAAAEVSRERTAMTVEFIQKCVNEHSSAVGGRLALELASELPMFLKANEAFVRNHTERAQYTAAVANTTAAVSPPPPLGVTLRLLQLQHLIDVITTTVDRAKGIRSVASTICTLRPPASDPEPRPPNPDLRTPTPDLQPCHHQPQHAAARRYA